MTSAREEAISAFRDAIRLHPNYALAHCLLGNALVGKGEFLRALRHLNRGEALRGEQRWPFQSQQWLKDCERYVELDQRLTRVLKGQDQPASTAERCEFARVSHLKGFYDGAARLYAEVFKDSPELANDLTAKRRLYAATAAALAGSGLGKDGPGLDPQTRTLRRKQALGWLRQDLEQWSEALKRNAPRDRARARQVLSRWERSPDLAGLREDARLGNLAPDEREAWRALWADVADLLKKVTEKPPGRLDRKTDYTSRNQSGFLVVFESRQLAGLLLLNHLDEVYPTWRRSQLSSS